MFSKASHKFSDITRTEFVGSGSFFVCTATALSQSMTRVQKRGGGLAPGQGGLISVARADGKNSRDLGGDPVPKAIDEFIDGLSGLSGMSLHLEPKEHRDGSAREVML